MYYTSATWSLVGCLVAGFGVYPLMEPCVSDSDLAVEGWVFKVGKSWKNLAVPNDFIMVSTRLMCKKNLKPWWFHNFHMKSPEDYNVRGFMVKQVDSNWPRFGQNGTSGPRSWATEGGELIERKHVFFTNDFCCSMCFLNSWFEFFFNRI